MTAGRRTRTGLIGLVLLLVLAAAGYVLLRRQPAATPQQAALPVYHGPLEVLAMPDAGRKPLLQIIDGAQHSIRLKIYLVTDNTVVEALGRAAQRGVDVRVLIEEEPYGGGETNALAARDLAAAGVTVRARPAAFVYSHEKSLVVDDGRALIMTHNLTNSSFNKNREYLVIVEDPTVVAEVVAVFEADWERQEPDLSQAGLVWSPVNSRSRIEALIAQAQVSLDLQQTSLEDPAVMAALAAAARRGVRVRVITPAIFDPSEREYAPVSGLAAAGVAVRFLDAPYIHAKTFIVDGQLAMIGSQNLTANSLENNRELGIVFDDPAAVNRLARTFLVDWNSAEPWGGPQPTATLPTGGILRWDQTADYIGQTVTVEGEVVDTYDSGKVTFLNFDEDRTFTVVIFASDYGAFSQPPEDAYWRKKVRVTGQLKLYNERAEMIIEAPDAIVVLEDMLTRSGQVQPTPPPDGMISWQDAGLYLGQRLVVEGEVVRVYNSGKAAFLNFAEQYQGQFSVVIFAADFGQWPKPPDEVYLGQRVRVRGKIKEYKGAPEMVVESPQQIEIVSAPAPEPTAVITLTARLTATLPLTAALPLSATLVVTATAVPSPTVPSAALLIEWQQAASYAGREVVVEGSVIDSYKSDSVIFLNFSTARDEFKAVIFRRDWPQWPQSPDQWFLGQRVRIRGEVVLYEGAPEIIINDPAQIEIVGQSAGRTTPVPPPLVSWEEAAAYAGQRVTVAGQVVDTYRSEKVIFLNFSANRQDFKVVIFASAWERWQQRPDELYYGALVHVTGAVELYEGTPEIIVDEPSQLVIIR
ncbi:MAG: phospholipase D-like domain-containing protein [Caldilineales bacterium]